MIDQLPICPLTGLPTKGRAKLSHYLGNPLQFLYEFAPIGKAVFAHGQVIAFQTSAANKTLKPNTTLAGKCREAAELGQPPVFVTAAIYHSEIKEHTPQSFEEKRAHLMRLLYEVGGKEHRKRDISIHNDFPLAFAKDAEEFSCVLESLVDEGLLKFDKPNDTPNEWINGMRTDYYGVLFTYTGKQFLNNYQVVSSHSSDDYMTNESLVRQQARSAYSQATSAHYTFNTPKGNEESVNKLLQALSRIYRKDDKSIFLDELGKLLNKEIEKHKERCTMKDAECPTEAGMRQVLYYVEQEVERLAQPNTPAPFLNQFNFGSGSTSNVATGPNSVQASNTGTGAQLNVASGYSVTQTISGEQISSLKELTEQLRKALNDESKLDSQREEVEDELNRIDAQLRKAEPKKSILTRSFEALHDLAKDGLGSVGGHAVFELLLQTPKLLESFN